MNTGSRQWLALGCLFVIAIGGYVGWQEYQRTTQGDQPRGLIGEVACQLRLREVKASRFSDDDKPYLTNCMMGGFITKGDLDEAGLSP